MGLLEIFIIAVGLSMDAFAVSITLGLSVKKPRIREYLIPGIFFGFFQGLMPLIGHFAGSFFAGKIQNYDHWIAFVLLGFIGGNMIRESFSKDDDAKRENDFKFFKMLVLAIATSIDALAVGITFAFFEVSIYISILIIGTTTFIISVAGVKIGNIFGIKFKSKAEFIGGLVLVLLGIKILLEHLFFSGL